MSATALAVSGALIAGGAGGWLTILLIDDQGALVGAALGAVYLVPFALAVAGLLIGRTRTKMVLWVVAGSLAAILSFTELFGVTLALLPAAVFLIPAAAVAGEARRSTAA